MLESLTMFCGNGDLYLLINWPEIKTVVEGKAKDNCLTQSFTSKPEIDVVKLVSA